METGDSTFARRQIGKQLRYLRETSGVSVDVVKKALGVSTQTIWRMETGQPTKIGRLHIKELCRLYGAPESTMLVLLELLEGASRKSWWHAYGDAVPRHFDLYLGLESAASKLVTHQPSLLPGLCRPRSTGVPSSGRRIRRCPPRKWNVGSSSPLGGKPG